MEEQSLYPAAALGFRCWLLVQGHLFSVGIRSCVWDRAVNRAVCHAGHKHPAPDAECRCGIHAYHALGTALNHVKSSLHSSSFFDRDFHVIGAIAARGEMQVHHSGFRAAEAQVLGLLLTSTQVSSGAAGQLEELYGVPYVSSPDALVELTADQAVEIDPGERPASILQGAARWTFREELPRCHDQEEMAELAEELELSLVEFCSLAAEEGLGLPLG